MNKKLTSTLVKFAICGKAWCSARALGQSLTAFRTYILLIVVLGLATDLGFSQKPKDISKDCARQVLKKPDAYAKGSEKYYLAWVETGSTGQRAIASQELLELDQTVEYDIAQELWRCERNEVVRYSLLLLLFDQQPEIHATAVTELLTKKHGGATGRDVKLKGFGKDTPERYSRYLQMGHRTLWFDWADNAAIRLIKKGYISDISFYLILNLAWSWRYDTFRVEAKKVFEMFDDFPPYNPGDPYKFAKLQAKQLKVIEKWYVENRTRLKWDTSRSRYVLSPVTSVNDK